MSTADREKKRRVSYFVGLNDCDDSENENENDKNKKYVLKFLFANRQVLFFAFFLCFKIMYLIEPFRVHLVNSWT